MMKSSNILKSELYMDSNVVLNSEILNLKMVWMPFKAILKLVLMVISKPKNTNSVLKIKSDLY